MIPFTDVKGTGSMKAEAKLEQDDPVILASKLMDSAEDASLGPENHMDDSHDTNDCRASQKLKDDTGPIMEDNDSLASAPSQKIMEDAEDADPDLGPESKVDDILDGTGNAKKCIQLM